MRQRLSKKEKEAASWVRPWESRNRLPVGWIRSPGEQYLAFALPRQPMTNYPIAEPMRPNNYFPQAVGGFYTYRSAVFGRGVYRLPVFHVPESPLSKRSRKLVVNLSQCNDYAIFGERCRKATSGRAHRELNCGSNEKAPITREGIGAKSEEENKRENDGRSL